MRDLGDVVGLSLSVERRVPCLDAERQPSQRTKGTLQDTVACTHSPTAGELSLWTAPPPARAARDLSDVVGLALCVESRVPSLDAEDANNNRWIMGRPKPRRAC